MNPVQFPPIASPISPLLLPTVQCGILWNFGCVALDLWYFCLGLVYQKGCFEGEIVESDQGDEVEDRGFMGNFRVYRYTVRDVSMRSGNSERAVRRHAKEGRLDMEDIVSVGRYIESEGGRNGKATR